MSVPDGHNKYGGAMPERVSVKDSKDRWEFKQFERHGKDHDGERHYKVAYVTVCGGTGTQL